MTAHDDDLIARALLALVLALLVLVAAACGADEAAMVMDDPEKRVSVEDACLAQAESWCVAFELCPGNTCQGIPECRPDRTTPDWLEVCVPLYAASCELARTEPIEVSRLAACLDAIREQSCGDFGLPEECVW